MLKERIQRYLKTSEVPMTKFCKHVDLSTNSMYRYLRGDVRFSLETEDRIKSHLKQFNF